VFTARRTVFKSLSVLIPDGDNHRALKVVRSIAYSGCRHIYIIADTNRNVHFSGHCKSFVFSPQYETENDRLNRIIDIIQKYNIDILLPISEKGIKFVIFYKKLLDNYCRIALIPDDKSFETARNKWFFHRFAVQNNLPVPKTTRFTDFFNDREIIKKFSFPILLKPIIGEGGVGIHFFEYENQFHQFFDNKDNLKHYNSFLIQEYIKGNDGDLSALCKNGKILAYTIQRPLQKHGGAFSFGKIIQFIRNDEILDIGKKLLSDLQWNGIVHIDFLIDDKSGSVKILEMNPRFWGSLYGSVSAGVNFPYLACLAALEKPFSMPPYEKTIYAELNNMEKLHLLFGKKQSKGITLKETDFRYVIRDPIFIRRPIAFFKNR